MREEFKVARRYKRAGHSQEGTNAAKTISDVNRRDHHLIQRETHSKLAIPAGRHTNSNSRISMQQVESSVASAGGETTLPVLTKMDRCIGRKPHHRDTQAIRNQGWRGRSRRQAHKTVEAQEEGNDCEDSDFIRHVAKFVYRGNNKNNLVEETFKLLISETIKIGINNDIEVDWEAATYGSTNILDEYQI